MIEKIEAVHLIKSYGGEARKYSKVHGTLKMWDQVSKSETDGYKKLKVKVSKSIYWYFTVIVKEFIIIFIFIFNSSILLLQLGGLSRATNKSIFQANWVDHERIFTS